MAPTLQMTVSFIRPVPVGVRLLGRGEVVRKGRQAIFTQGFLRSEDGKLLASSSAMPAGDQPRAQVRWSSGRNVTAGERIQLRFILSRGAKIYSWWMA